MTHLIPAALCLAIAGLVAIIGGIPVVLLIVKLAKIPEAPRKRIPTPSGELATELRSAADISERQTAVLHGGLWIGLLERTAVFLAIVCGQPALITIVVAVKGLGRWSQLQENSALAERFIIGTFASLLWAVLVAAAALGVLQLMS